MALLTGPMGFWFWDKPMAVVTGLWAKASVIWALGSGVSALESGLSF